MYPPIVTTSSTIFGGGGSGNGDRMWDVEIKIGLSDGKRARKETEQESRESNL